MSKKEVWMHKVASEEFYKDWLRPVLDRRGIQHELFVGKIPDGLKDCYIRCSLNGKDFHNVVVRARCEQEENERNLGEYIHVISWREYVVANSGGYYPDCPGTNLEGDCFNGYILRQYDVDQGRQMGEAPFN